MNTEEKRWHQRLNNLSKALKQLNSGVKTANKRKLNDLERQGLIQSFEFSHELAWKVMKDYFYYQGNSEIRGSRDATREAFRNNLIDKGEVWMEMIRSRNKTTHTYDESTANEIIDQILKYYAGAFNSFYDKMLTIKEQEA